VWWAWHIPIYLADGKANTAFEWAVFLVTTLSLSLIVSWLYLRTGGSVLIATLFHTSSNYAVFVFLRTFWQPSGDAQVLRLAYAAILVVAAALAATALWRRDPKHVEASGSGRHRGQG
jgi:membrane protease YdiL (CAAX protease family)